jgi:hypothetical protein
MWCQIYAHELMVSYNKTKVGHTHHLNPPPPPLLEMGTDSKFKRKGVGGEKLWMSSSERVSVNLERRRQEGPKKYNGMVMPPGTFCCLMCHASPLGGVHMHLHKLSLFLQASERITPCKSALKIHYAHPRHGDHYECLIFTNIFIKCSKKKRFHPVLYI